MNERSIFLTAIEIVDPAARAAYLKAACDGDAPLLARLEALLAAHEQTGGFMVGPAADRELITTLPDLPRPEPAEGMVGAVLADRYVLVGEIGRGGMGTVYRAEQIQPVRRSVAVKLINPGMDSRLILSRFEAERQALALMAHPNIAGVLDAGATPDGRPFFVMELVDGVPLTAYCDARRLTVGRRIELFGRVCRAVQHAHQKGIIHRDLKPSNILVEDHGGEPIPKVIDFGLAKAVGGTVLTEDSLLTAPGSLAGSPLYMAPEQTGADARDVDVRADVYALGGVLYELLTGSTPIPHDDVRRAALVEVVRMIREEEPPAPSRRLGQADALPSAAAARATEPVRLQRMVRGDLDWVAMKAIEKDRERRYESASALAADLERFLNHEPVSAGPPTASYRLRKFVRRHRAAVTGGGLVFLTLVLGVVGTGWGLVRASAERDRAARATDRAFRALDTLTEDALESLLARQASWGDRERAYLGRIREQFEQLAAAEGESDSSRRMRAASRLRLGSIRSLLGDVKAAEADYRAAAAEFARLPGAPDRANGAQAIRRLGGLLATTGHAAEALREYDRATRAYDGLVADFPGDRTFRLGSALVRNDSGFVHFASGELEAAEADCRRASGGLASLAREFPDEPEYPVEQARALHNLYMVLSRSGRPGEAERAIDEAITLLRAAGGRRQDPRVTLALGKALQSRVAVLLGRGDVKGAEPVQREVVSLHAGLAAEYPAAMEHRSELARGQLNLGVLHAQLGQSDSALAAYREAESTAGRLADRFPEVDDYRAHLAHARLAVGEELAANGRHEEAMASLSAALPIWERLRAGNPGSPSYAAGLLATLARLGESAAAQEDHPRAQGYLERADRLRSEAAEVVGRDPKGANAVLVLLPSLTAMRLSAGDHAGAAAAADELAGIECADGAIFAYNAGCWLARCSALAAHDPELDAAERAARAEAYAARAVAHLRTAVARGFDDAGLLANDADLAPLRERPDFRAIVIPRR